MSKNLFQPIRDWRLRKKLIVSFVLLVMLPVLVFGGYTAWHTHRSMAERVEDSFYDSVYQISTRISHQFDSYNADLRFLAMNRSIARIFNDEDSTYYQQYEDMTEVLEPTLLMIQQLAPQMEAVGIYTANHHLSERNGSVLYLERLEEKPWFDRISRSSRIQWFGDSEGLTGLAWAMQLSSAAPQSYAYVRVSPEAAFDVTLENIPAYGITVEDEGGVIYARGVNMDLPAEPVPGEGVQLVNGRRVMAVRCAIAATGWTLCVYCPYEALHVDIRDTLISLTLLGAASLLLLSMVGIAVADSISRRVDRLNASFSRVEAGSLVPCDEPMGGDEIGELAQHFNRMVAALDDHIRTNYQNRILLREAELKALQAQINPHFLYNSLSLINWMAIARESMDISEIACALSDFYRSVLNNGESTMTVRSELKNIEAYLKIQLCMHSDSFTAEVKVAPEIMDCEILGIILQPLVENAIEHGVDCRREGEGGRVIITGEASGDNLIFCVEDNGPGITAEQFRQSVTHSSKSYGLKNVQDRLRIAYGEPYGLSLDETCAEGTRIYIHIPRKPFEKRDTKPKNVGLC